MTINWASLIAVFLVSFGSTVAVVVLVAVATLGLSARGARPASIDRRTGNSIVLAHIGDGGGRDVPGRRGRDRAPRALGDSRAVVGRRLRS